MVECRTPKREVGGSKPTAAVLCPWARHFTPRKYWLITQEAVAPSRHDWKIVDWDVKPEHKQTILRVSWFRGYYRPWMLLATIMWAATWQNQQNDCASSEDSDQPGHAPSLIRGFAVRMKKVWVLSYPLSALRRVWSDWADAQADLRLWSDWAWSDQTGRMPRLIWDFAGLTLILLVLSCRGSCFLVILTLGLERTLICWQG